MVMLEAGALMLEIDPALGGSIRAFDWRLGGGAVPVLRDGRRGDGVLDASSFPLVPYVNRIRGGRFTFGDREVRLEPNMAGDPSPLHGHGWLRAWEVEDATETEATLAFRYAAEEWPWSYLARQHFALDAQGLSLRLTCRNLGDDQMPCGLGQHPYFMCGSKTRIDTRVATAWTVDDQVLPVEQVPATGRFDLRDRPACGQGLDNGFGGWDGAARMSDPDWPFDVALTSPDAAFFQLYSPAAGGIFVAEPVTHANAALNAPAVEWPALGLRILDPGEEMHLHMRIEVTPK